jgi:3-oxoacyl-[acyl-carrier-protein] synthase III
MTYPQPLKIVGVGHYLPKRVVTSAEIEQEYGYEEGWIERKQGVTERRWVEDETASFMAAEAAKEAVRDAGIELTDLDLILNASGTPDQLIPDGACLIQRELGLGSSGIACMSVHTTCLSFLNGLYVASNLIAGGDYEHILLVSSDISSRNLNFEHPESSTLFGDLAAAAVLTRTPEGEESCVHAAKFATYGDGAEYTQIPGGGTRMNPILPERKKEDFYFYMDGPAVLKWAIKYAGEFMESLRPGLSEGLGDIQLVVPHQASKVALDAHSAFGIPQEVVVRTIDKVGNCVAASLPYALYVAIKTGRLVRGDKVLLAGTGAGLNFGGLIITY